VSGLAGLILTRWRRLAGVPVALLLGLACAGTLLELRDPFVGPAMLREAGRLYPLHFYASTALGIALTVAYLLPPFYSARIAFAGSTSVARLAGSSDATNTTRSSAPRTTPSVSGSYGAVE
jgi:hypothetical protein